jgi:hypothetical protein
MAVVLGIAAFWISDAIARFGRLGFPMDDPYIHFQFARNLASGAGFAFNPHEPTPGATSPLWVVLLAAGARLGATPPAVAIVLGIGAACAAAWLTFDVGRRAGLTAPFAFFAALMVAASGRFAWASVSGMETCLAAALALAVVRIQLSGFAGWRRAALLGVIAGLAAQARPELLMLGGLVPAIEWTLPRAADGAPRAASRPLMAGVFLAAFAAVVAPYAIFCLATSGRPFPNTFYAKSVIPSANPEIASQRASYIPWVFRWAWYDQPLSAVLLLPGLIVWLRARSPAARLVAISPLAFWIYALVLQPRHFSLSRYTIPLIPMVALFSISAADALARRFARRAARDALTALTAVLVVAGAIAGLPRFRAVYLANVGTTLGMQVRMGRWVAANLPPDARVATNDVGAITYFGGRYCIDTVGLVSSKLITEELAWRRGHSGMVAVEQVLPGFLAESRADYCILFPDWYPHLVRAPWLEPIHEIRQPNSTGGGDALVVFRVVGPPAVTGP